MESILLNYLRFFPITILLWIFVYLSVRYRPHRFRNSFYLLWTILFTLFFISSLFGDWMSYAMLTTLLLIALGLLLVPILLIHNGIVMIKKESFALAHVLSLILGILIFLGEAAFIGMVLLASYMTDTTSVIYYISGFLGFSAFYFCSVLLAFVLYMMFLQFVPHRHNFKYVIIHGCALNGEEPGKILAHRLDKAVQLYRKSPVKPYLIPSGGQGDDEVISEAEAMKRYLMARGIPEEHIIKEELSTTTMENLEESFWIIKTLNQGAIPKKGCRIALISSNYHIYRCLVYAHTLKVRCTGIGAHVASYYWPCAVIREFAAIFSKKKYILIILIGYILFAIQFCAFLGLY